MVEEALNFGGECSLFVLAAVFDLKTANQCRKFDEKGWNFMRSISA